MSVCGSKPALTNSESYFRSSRHPKNGHRQAVPVGPVRANTERRRCHHSLVVTTSTGLVTVITPTSPLTFCESRHTLAQVEKTAPFARDQSHILDGEVGRISRN
jgi:hypothetical protein